MEKRRESTKEVNTLNQSSPCQVTLNLQHKSVQEYCAAKYVLITCRKLHCNKNLIFSDS